MELRRRSILISLGISLLAVTLIASIGHKQQSRIPLDESQQMVEATPEAGERDTARETTAKDDSIDYVFTTDTKTPYTLWETTELKVYVQDQQLLFTTGDSMPHVLYEWKAAGPAQVWNNGEYLLIGTQADVTDIDSSWSRYYWVALQVYPKPKVIYEELLHYGPQEVLSVAASDQPRLFFFTLGRSSEYIFDPAQSRWITLNSVNLDDQKASPIPTKQHGMRRLTESCQFPLRDGFVIHCLIDESSSVIFTDWPYPVFTRVHGYDLVDAKLMTVLDDSPQVIVKYRNRAGKEVSSFLSWSTSHVLSAVPGLWEEDWQALNRDTLVRRTPNGLFRVKLDEEHAAGEPKPEWHYLETGDARWVSSQGLLMKYMKDGEERYISWYDVMNTADGSEVDPDSIWSVSLERYTTREEWHETVYDRQPGTVLEWRDEHAYVYGYDVYNTNAPLPDEYFEGEGGKYEGDYGASRTFRKIGSRWYVLVDRMFNEMVDGELVEIGEWPVTVTVEVGEAFGGLGARDFVRAGDYWFVADTEASRVIKLNDQSEVVAELIVPTPDRIAVDGKRLHVTTLTSTWTVDLDLRVMEIKTRPFTSSTKLNKVEYEYFSDQQRYVDPESGLTWYYLGGKLYEYHEGKQEYRALYMGYNENLLANVRIMPYGDEVLVVLDRRLERFDRKGNWLSTIEYPRSKPDGIYAETPLGENSIYLDNAAGILYLVQGFRVLGIDLNQGEVRTIFRQNNSNIGKLIPYEGSLYFMFHSSNEHHYQVWSRQADPKDLYIEVVKIDLMTSSIRRYIVDEYYDEVDIESGADGQPIFNLLRYTWQ